MKHLIIFFSKSEYHFIRSLMVLGQYYMNGCQTCTNRCTVCPEPSMVTESGICTFKHKTLFTLELTAGVIAIVGEGVCAAHTSIIWCIRERWTLYSCGKIRSNS